MYAPEQEENGKPAARMVVYEAMTRKYAFSQIENGAGVTDPKEGTP